MIKIRSDAAGSVMLMINVNTVVIQATGQIDIMGRCMCCYSGVPW